MGDQVETMNNDEQTDGVPTIEEIAEMNEEAVESNNGNDDSTTYNSDEISRETASEAWQFWIKSIVLGVGAAFLSLIFAQMGGLGLLLIIITGLTLSYVTTKFLFEHIENTIEARME